MSWKETQVMSERIRLMADYLDGDHTVTELALKYGASRKTVYKWLAPHSEEGWDGLQDRPRAPLCHPNAIPESVERQILLIKERKPLWGVPKIRQKVMEASRASRCPAESTVSEILRRHGLTRTRKRRRVAVPSEAPLSHCHGPNVVWCADFKGWFLTRDGSKCTPLTISDSYSRYLLCCQGLGGSTGGVTVKPWFIATFRRYGMPAAIRTDNGPPFATRTLGGLSRLSVWWLLLGIGLERIEPGKPQQNGRHERMHRTLKEATANPPHASLRAQQRAFELFRKEYNEERPHEALGQKTPAEFHVGSPREYPEREPRQRGYPDDWEKRRVRDGGRIKWKGVEINVTLALKGREIGLKPVDTGKWVVYFEHLELGIFDERQGCVRAAKRLKPVSTSNPATP